MAKASTGRWQNAQSYERGHWERQAEGVAENDYQGIDWYDWRAEYMVSCLKEVGLDHLAGGDRNLIEVGSGPVGVVSHIPGKRRVAVDPLGDFYGGKAELTAYRDPEVEYLASQGEDLNVQNDTFDLAIIENCIDHVQDTDAVMQELRRVLRPGGILYLTVNLRTLWGYRVHRILSRLQVDTGHPHTFRSSNLRTLLKENGFEILSWSGTSMLRAWWTQLKTPSLRERLKALIGVTESEVFVVARARPTQG